ncbi:MAG: hypothetical protein QG637_1131 [Chloroflexota bacterium]|nr:hypothetical protein [Chloroflexota bacterium]
MRCCRWLGWIFGKQNLERRANIMERKWDSRLDELGVRLEAPEQAEYRLVEGRWVGPDEAGDKRLIYVRVLDPSGAPLEGQPFRITNGGERIERTKGGGFDQFWGNYPMFSAGLYAVDIPDATSDKVSYLPTGFKEDPYANTCYYLVFQRGASVVEPIPTPDPEPIPLPTPDPEPIPVPEPDPTPIPPPLPTPAPPKLDEATRGRLLALLDQAQAELAAARKLLEA